MKLTLIADTHEFHNKVVIPPTDVLVHAGDLTFRGEYTPLYVAIAWLKAQPAKHRILIGGNHDWLFEKNPESARSLLADSGIHYLEDSSVVIAGVKFWGSPYTPRFMDWAFNCDRADISKHWDKIPDDTDVLITHGPPSGILDQAQPKVASEHLGCYDLRQALERVRPKIHVFGHIHGGYGYRYHEKLGTHFFNASVVNEAYRVVNKPFEVDYSLIELTAETTIIRDVKA